jgi:hypothetical protein
VWNVIAESDQQCFDIVVSEDDELNIGCYTKLRENIGKSNKYALLDEEKSKVVTSFLT